MSKLGGGFTGSRGNESSVRRAAMDHNSGRGGGIVATKRSSLGTSASAAAAGRNIVGTAPRRGRTGASTTTLSSSVANTGRNDDWLGIRSASSPRVNGGPRGKDAVVPSMDSPGKKAVANVAPLSKPTTLAPATLAASPRSPAEANVESAEKHVDAEMRSAVMRVFEWCDADGDGLLNRTEFAAAQRLVAELCPEEFDESVAVAFFNQASDGTSDGFVEQDGFLVAMQQLLDALPLPRSRLLDGLKRQTSGRTTAFDRSVSDFKNALVRNVSTLPESAATPRKEAPPQLELWRTTTGRNEFPLPAGAGSRAPPAAQVAFKTMQYLGMRTEDASIIDASLAGKMMGHRQMFKNILDMCGEIRGVHVVNLGVQIYHADLFLTTQLLEDGAPLFRVRMTNLQVSSGPILRLNGMSGFEPAPIESSEVPAPLWAEMQQKAKSSSQQHGLSGAEQDLSALGMGTSPRLPPQPSLGRQTSLPIDTDLETIDLVLTSSPVARHTFRLSFKLMDKKDGMPPPPQYLLLLPRLQTADKGHARYADHVIRVKHVGSSVQPEVAGFGSFVITTVQNPSISSLVVEHEYTSCHVRVQPRAAASRAEIVPVVELSLEERANCLADTSEQAERLRRVLQSRGLARRASERDIAYAVRLGRALCNGYKYDVAATEAYVRELPPLIWEQQKGDCSAFNAGFVYALRAFGVPARVSLGFKYGSAVKQACGSIAAPHAQSEFFAEGIGWIPCDATLGIKRLGHEATGLISFVEWRPATLSLAEAEELTTVFLPPRNEPCASKKDFESKVEALGISDRKLSAAELAAVVSSADAMTRDAAAIRVARVLQCANKFGSSSTQQQLTVGEFARLRAAIELGAFKELGEGDGLTNSSRAGAKFFEGGPYLGEPIDQRNLRPNMIVQDDIEQVMQTVGGRGGHVDWSSMWPYGVFSCTYEFEEKSLP
eukprot:TRINITY_DN4526_c0_g2_i1.p1 TRINITY_DN4526_c0_g2~~TRINITY_DN4526_c0_g2_i1.p1  ORF type:complete len:943 (+),score=148.36 TRINITY_DN4526_c0_g2_i1:94-2922(+)